MAEKTKGTIYPVSIFPSKLKDASVARSKLEDDLDFLHSIISHELVKKPQIYEFDSPKHSVQNMAQHLLGIGSEQGADIYVLNKTNSSEFSNFLIGNFSETFLHITKTPTLLIDDEFRDIKNILFSTDFSENSFAAFKNVAKLTKRLKAKLTIYHQLEWLTYHMNAYDVSKFEQSETVSRWIKFCKTLNLNFEVTIKEHIVSPAESILNSEESIGADIISLVSKTGRLGTYLLGSTTRHVMRDTRTPLLIMYPIEKK